MANPIVQAVTLATADDDGISTSQSPGAAGNLTITGALASGGVATLTTAGSGTARQVIITSGGNDTGKTFTLYGTNATGNYLTESFAGANGGAAASAYHYQTVTRVAIDAASAGTVKVGTNGVGSTRTLNIDTALNPSNTTVTAVVSGIINYSLQWTVNNIQGVITWNDDPVLASQTASGGTSYSMPISGLRALVNSGTGTVTLNVLQTGLGS